MYYVFNRQNRKKIVLMPLYFSTEYGQVQCRHSIPVLNAPTSGSESGHACSTRLHAPLSPGFLDIDAWMTSQLNVASIGKLRGALVTLAYLYTCYLWVFV